MSSINRYFKEIRVLGRATEGAAMVEFAVAIFPLIALFFVQLQVCVMFSAHLHLHHAAVVAARCGIVEKGPNQPGDYVGNKDGKTDLRNAEEKCSQAAIDSTAIGYYRSSLWDIKATYEYKPSDNNATKSDNGNYNDLKTTLKAKFQCNVPVGDLAICGSKGGMKDLQIVLVLPHEGARYTLDDNRNP